MMKRPTGGALLVGAALLLLLSTPFGSARGDEPASRQELFGAIDDLFEEARDLDVLSLAPEQYAKAHEHYQKALESHRRGKSRRSIQRDLEKAREYLDAGIETARVCQIVLEDLVTMRRDAIELGVPELQPKLFDAAERRFLKAARQVEKENRRRAKSQASRVAESYRLAVKEALLSGPVAEAKALLKTTRGELTRQSRQQSERGLREVESFVRATTKTEFDVMALWTTVERDIRDVMRAARDAVKASLPDILTMGGFRLRVQEYTDFGDSRLSGKAYGHFVTAPCGPKSTAGSSPFGTTIGVLQQSQIPFEVEFKDLRVAHWPPQKAETVVSGKIDQRYADPIHCDVDDFDLEISRLVLEPKTAQADVTLLFSPHVLSDARRCQAATVGPLSVSIDSTCSIRASLPRAALDSVIVGNTGMMISARGVEIDLASTPRTVTLQEGCTLPPQPYASNTGYLFGDYRFKKAIITGCGGLQAGFRLQKPCRYDTLLPSDFAVELADGELSVKNSAVSGGSYKGRVTMPSAVTDINGQAIAGTFTAAAVDSTLAFFGDVKLDPSRGIRWGGFSLAAGEGRLYLPAAAGIFSPSPMNPVGEAKYQKLDALKLKAALQTIPGLTIDLLHPASGDRFTAYSPDTKNPITFALQQKQLRGWINIAGGGITGELQSAEEMKLLDVPMGQTQAKDYKARQSFAATFEHHPDSLLWVDFRFVRNAVSDSYTGGRLDIPYPSGFEAKYRDLELTSTAQMVGGDVFFKEKELKFWGVRMTADTTGNALSVDTGEIIYMNSSISEKVHFTKPFRIIWGEMLADGNLGRFVFDYNSAGQQFDGIPFTLHAAALSEYKPGSPTSNALMGSLNAYGDVHFDFFGAKRIDILDYKDDRKNHGQSPYYKRFVDLNQKKTSLHFNKSWGSGTAQMVFDAAYDTKDQNGFQGINTAKPMAVGLQFLPTMKAGELHPQTIDLNGGCSYIHFCVGASAKATSEVLQIMDLDMASVASVGGLIQIKGDSVKRIVLEGHASMSCWSFEGNSLTSVDITPNTVTLRTRDQMSIASYNVGLLGLAATTLILNAKDASLEGDVTGVFQVYGGSNFAINQSAYCEIEARGRFNFYFSPITNYVQGYGKVSIKLGYTFDCEGAFFAGHAAPVDKIWALDKITRGPSIRETLKGQGRTHLSGIYVAGSFSYKARIAEVIEGGYTIWAGVGFFGPTIAGSMNDPSVTFLMHAGVGVEGEVFEGLAAASAWVEYLGSQTVSAKSWAPKICVQCTMGFRVCVLIFCANWQGTVAISDQGLQEGGCYTKS